MIQLSLLLVGQDYELQSLTVICLPVSKVSHRTVFFHLRRDPNGVILGWGVEATFKVEGLDPTQ